MEERNRKTREELNKLNTEFKQAIQDSKKWNKIDFNQEYQLLKSVSNLKFMNKKLIECNNYCEHEGIGEYFSRHNFNSQCYSDCYTKVHQAHKQINNQINKLLESYDVTTI